LPARRFLFRYAHGNSEAINDANCTHRDHAHLSIISASRFWLLRKLGLRDPLVGRDLLFGVLLGMFWLLVFVLDSFFMIRLGESPRLTSPEFLQGTREAVALGLVTVVGSIRTTLVFFFLIVLLRVLVRNRWVAATIFVLLFTVTESWAAIIH